MYRNLTATQNFIVRDATGPNPDDLAGEIMDGDGDRLAYVSSIDEAADEIRKFVGPGFNVE